MAKHAGGRPSKHTNPDEMQIIIDNYFIECDEDKRPYTVTGLAAALDLTRTGLCEYAAKGEFSNTIKRAKRRVETSVEERLLSGTNAAGSIFWMKNNAGWKDTQTIDMNMRSVSEMTDDELLAEAEGIRTRN